MRQTLIVLALSTTAALAQASATQSRTFGCPVGFTAQLSDVATTLWAASQEDARNPQTASEPHMPNSGVRVELMARSAVAIKQAEVVVEFLPPGLRYVPAGSGTMYSLKGSPEQVAKKTFELGGGAPLLRLASDLLIGPSASVKVVHLLRLDFADGTRWHPMAGGSYPPVQHRTEPLPAGYFSVAQCEVTECRTSASSAMV